MDTRDTWPNCKQNLQFKTIIMKDFSLIHYYYGDRFITFKTGLGSVIRAKGHSLDVTIIVIENSLPWMENTNLFMDFDTSVVSLKDKIAAVTMLREIIVNLDNTLLLIVNFDLIIEEKVLSIKDFTDIIRRKKTTTEIILTGKIHYPQVEELADYVSYVKSAEN